MERTLGEVARETAAGQAWDAVHTESWQAVADAMVAEYERRRWRAISEAHEDWGICVFINIHSPEPVCASTLDDEFQETAKYYGWTHFAPITLTTESAERLKTTIPAPPNEASDE